MMHSQIDTIHIMHTDPVIRAGLHAILSTQDDWHVTLEPTEAQTSARSSVVVTDYAAGVELARTQGERRPVLVITQFDKEWEVRHAMENGVHGYVLQSCLPDELVKAARKLAEGQRYQSEPVARRVAESLRRSALTGRETDVLHLLAEGCCNKRIARRLGIGVGTVKTHIKSLMNKLDATARTHAVVVAVERGLVMSGRSMDQRC